MALLQCRDLSFAYEGKLVVDKLNLTVEEGDYLCIVGENGSGKSTLVKGLLGLIAPSGGKVIFGDGLQKNQIGYLPQHAEIQRDFPASAWEVVISGCRSAAPFLNRAQKARARQMMESLSVETVKKQRFSTLSGGQQQRILLARALLATNSLLLLDEPTAGLDPLATRDLYEAVSRLHQEQGLTIIMISHDIAATMEYADHILHLSHASAFYGTAAQYAASPLGKAFAGRGVENA